MSEEEFKLEDVKVWHYMINPYNGSEPLCGSSGHNEGVTLGGERVTCVRCLTQMDGLVARQSRATAAALEAQAETAWRQGNPTAAALYDSLQN